MRIMERLSLEWLDYYDNIKPNIPITVYANTETMNDLDGIRSKYGSLLAYYEHMSFNAVTINDLFPLAQNPLSQGNGGITTPPPNGENPGQNGETLAPPPDEKPQSGNMGTIIFIVIIAVAGGGAGWYFKIYRPKQQGGAGGEEYDPSMNDSENDYSDDWGADADDSDDSEDSPPWDEDENSGDNDDE